MKKLLLIGFCSLTSMVFSQTQRMVLVEHFTQASCGPCAGYNPSLQAMLDDPQNAGQLTSIKYQVSWPGYDPMYEHNPSQVDTRVSYYGVTGVPNPELNGNLYSGTGFDQSHIDDAKADSSDLEMTLTHEFSENLDKIVVNLKIKALQTVSGSLVAHVAVVEQEINFTSAPGSNGERDFYHVMKKMLPSATGTSLGSSIAMGDSVEMTYSWEMENVYDKNELAVVAFVQNNANKNVLQAAYSEPIAYESQYATNIIPIQIDNVPEVNCSGKVKPSFIFRNVGNDQVTSAEFEYSINGGATSTVNWSGLLNFDQEAQVIMDEETFSVQNNNDFTLVVKSVNGQTDGYSVGDTMSIDFTNSQVYNARVKIKLFSGANGEDVEWKILASDGSTVKSGSSYLANENYLEEYWMRTDDCYEIIFKHPITSFGGTFQFYDGDNNKILSVLGGKDVLETRMFTVDPSTVGIENIKKANIEVYPNPVKDILVIENADVNSTFEILNVTGSVVNNGVIKSELQQLNINLESGVYFLKVNGDGSHISKFIVK